MGRLYNLLFGLTKSELAEINKDVLLAMSGIKDNPRQLKLTKKLIRLIEKG